MCQVHRHNKRGGTWPPDNSFSQTLNPIHFFKTVTSLSTWGTTSEVHLSPEGSSNQLALKPTEDQTTVCVASKRGYLKGSHVCRGLQLGPLLKGTPHQHKPQQHGRLLKEGLPPQTG